jgi:hypothetical protein
MFVFNLGAAACAQSMHGIYCEVPSYVIEMLKVRL